MQITGTGGTAIGTDGPQQEKHKEAIDSAKVEKTSP